MLQRLAEVLNYGHEGILLYERGQWLPKRGNKRKFRLDVNPVTRKTNRHLTSLVLILIGGAHCISWTNRRIYGAEQSLSMSET